MDSTNLNTETAEMNRNQKPKKLIDKKKNNNSQRQKINVSRPNMFG